MKSAPIIAALAPWQQSLLQWLGYDFSRSPEGGEAELIWTNLPASWGVFVLLAVLGAVLYGVWSLYRRELESCPPWAKLVLATLRAGVVLLLAIIFLGPALIYLQHRSVLPTIVVARDTSLSMNTADRYADEDAAQIAAAALRKTESELAADRPTRAAIVDQLLSAGGGKLLAAIAERGRLTAINFAEQATKVESRAPAVNEEETAAEAARPPLALPPLVADGRGTDLAGAIRQSLAEGTPSAVLLFTDGQHTGQDDPRDAAREAKARGVPLLVVGVGDPSRPRNLKVANLYVRPQVWQDEPFEIDAIVTAEGIEASEVRVELVEQRLTDSGQPGSGAVVQSLQLPVPLGGGRLRAEFSHTAKEAGRYQYSVRAEPVAGESDEADNQLAGTVVRVLSRERVRVLLVAGAPTWEYRLVQKLLARDRTITLSCWLQTLDEERAQEGTRPITRLPITKEELFYYDVILLFDPSPQEIDQAWIDLLEKFVGEHAGGLLYMAGPKHTSRLLTGTRTSGFAKLLPVSFGDLGALEVAALLSSNQRAWPLQIVPASADHPVLRFYPEREETLRRWETLPGIFWSFPAHDARPAAEILAEHSDPTLRSTFGSRPLLVAGRYGAGQTLYMGFNGTWRWRKAGRQAEFFDKFWIQAVRFLVEGRSLEGRRRGYVQTDRDHYEIGQRVTISARLQDATYNPLVQPKIEATLTAGDMVEKVTLLSVANQPGAYEASLIAKQTGVHTLRLAVPGETTGEQVETPFTVELPSVETNQVWLNKPLLADVASLSGGQYFDVHQLDQLAAAIPDKTETIEIRSQPRPLWDVGGMLIALVGLLGTEWFVRKWFRLL